MDIANMKPQRFTITHARTTDGRDLFTVSPNARTARAAKAEAERRGYTVVSQTARFDFTLQQWGLALDAYFADCQGAARAMSGVKPKAPRAPKAAPSARKTYKATGQVFATATPTYRDQKFVALAALEEVFVLRLGEQGVTQEMRDAYGKYKKVLARAMNPTSAVDPEAEVALRQATLTLVKLAY